MLAAVIVLALVFAFSAVGLAGNLTDGSNGPAVTLAESGGSPVFSINVDDTDLFMNFDGVMPGDSLTQTIVVRTASGLANNYNIYLYAVDGHTAETGEEEGDNAHLMDKIHDPEFLDCLTITVRDITNPAAPILLNLTRADATSLGVHLGRFVSSDSRTLEVTLEVDIEAGNEFQNASAFIDWVFTAQSIDVTTTSPIPTTPSVPVTTPPPTEIPEESPPLGTPTPTPEIPEEEVFIETPPPLDEFEDEPVPLAEVPQTGDSNSLMLWATMMFVSGAGIILLLVFFKPSKNKR